MAESIMPSPKDELCFQAAVERPLSAVFRTPGGAWEGHDYRVEAITQRQGLDAFDVVVDFRALESALDAALAPLQGRLLSDAGVDSPLELAERLLKELAAHVPAPAKLVEVALVDGSGRRISVLAPA
jgi:6-pyruvoyl tetrahydropterin synthase